MQVVALLRPLCVVSKNTRTSSRNFTYFDLAMNSCRAVIRARELTKLSFTDADIFRTEAIIRPVLKRQLNADLLETHTALRNWRLASKVLEVDIQNTIKFSTSNTDIPCFGLNVLCYLIDPTCLKVTQKNSFQTSIITQKDLPLACAKVEHNGRSDESAHFIPLLPLKSMHDVLMRTSAKASSLSLVPLGSEVAPPSKRQKGVRNYDRNAFNSKWEQKYLWIRHDSTYIWCYCCYRYNRG